MMNFINPDDITLAGQFNTQQAMIYQRQWSALLSQDDQNKTIETVAGVDVAYDKATNQAFAVAIVIDADSLAIREVQEATSTITIPYCSGFLSFREVPAISKALDKLNKMPDLIVCDGQGVAHPRGFGLACHLGLAYNIPTIGCGKSRLCGAADEPGPSRGNFSYLYDKHKTIIGCVLRTRNGVKPVYVSTGHKISLSTAREWILKLSPKYRLPETTRLADGYADEYKKSWLAQRPNCPL